MNLACLIVPLLALPSVATSQSSDDLRPEREVRDVIERYFAVRRTGNREAVVALTRPNAARFSAGGTRLGNLLGRGASDRRKISYFVRHVEFLRPDVALAVGLWRNTDPGALFPCGAFSYTLVKDGNTWKLATVQETLNQPLPPLPGSVASRPLKQEGDWQVLFDGQNAEHWLTLDGARDLGKSWRVADGSLIANPRCHSLPAINSARMKSWRPSEPAAWARSTEPATPS